MTTKPIPAGTRNFTLNLSEELHADLSELAAQSGMKLGAYVRQVLIDARQRRVRVQSLLLSGEPRPDPETKRPQYYTPQQTGDFTLNEGNPAVNFERSAEAKAAADILASASEHQDSASSGPKPPAVAPTGAKVSPSSTASRRSKTKP